MSTPLALRVEGRTLLAKTCSGCGDFLDACEFNFRQDRFQYSSKCRVCRTEVSNEWRRNRGRRFHNEASVEWKKRMAIETTEGAKRSGMSWEKWEDDVVRQPVPLLQLAKEVQRSLFAVSARRCALGVNNRVGSAAPQEPVQQWSINFPEASS